jgi:Zn-dependent peptidase ImmA (M78 family)
LIPTYFLYQLAEYEGIAIEWRDMHHVQGIYIHAPGAYKPVIALSNTLHTQERKLRCVLAHELGHHFTTSGHYIIAANSTSSVYATKHENLATKWAVNLLIPTDVFLQCIKDGMRAPCLVDYFYVTYDFVRLKREFMKLDERYSDKLVELKTSCNVFF